MWNLNKTRIIMNLIITLNIICLCIFNISIKDINYTLKIYDSRIQYINNYIETQIKKEELKNLEFKKNKKELEDISCGRVVLRF